MVRNRRRWEIMVLPGDDLETRIYRRSAADGYTTYQFETVRGDDPVITDGLAVIRD